MTAVLGYALLFFIEGKQENDALVEKQDSMDNFKKLRWL